MPSQAKPQNVNLERRDNRPTDLHQNEVISFVCVRNEELRLPHFLDYHRDLGVGRFFIIDNGSSDSTMEFLLAQPDVHVYYTEDSYADARCGIDWLNELLNHHGVGHWTLTLDADELLVYPLCESIKIQQLTNFLDQIEAQGLVTFLLDMYSDKTIKDSICQSGVPFQNICRYFDPDSYHEWDQTGIPIRGGPRHRLFWNNQNRKKPSPVLRKIPLVKWREGLKFEASTHTINHIKLASLSGVLQHFKFFSDLYNYVEQETARMEHWDGAAQYESYWNVLEDNPNLRVIYEDSVGYQNSMQLVELGLIKFSKEYEQFASKLATN